MTHGLLSKNKTVNSKSDSHESLGNEKDILQFIHDDPSAWNPSIPGPPILPLENNEVTPSLTMASGLSTEDSLFASTSSDIFYLSNFGE